VYGTGTVTHLSTGCWQVTWSRRARNVSEVHATLGVSTSASTGVLNTKLINVNSTSNLVTEVRHHNAGTLADVVNHADNWISVAVTVDDSKV
jgi:hypothetical protein